MYIYIYKLNYEFNYFKKNIFILKYIKNKN